MNRNTTYLFLVALFTLMVLSCDDYTEKYNVPAATTEPAFSYIASNEFVVPTTFTFTNETIIPEGVGEISYKWYFGDGDSSEVENPVHVYITEGEKIVRLVVTTSFTKENRTASEKFVFSRAIEGDTLFFEDFEDLSVIPSDWVLVNVDGNTPDNPNYASMADSAWIVTYSGSFESKVALGISFYLPEAGADDWMILPKVSLGNDPLLTWDAMSLTTSGNYPDNYQIYVSTTTQDVAGCQAEGVFFRVTGESWSETATLPGEGIRHRELNLSFYANQEVYIAFRLNTPTPGGDRLAIDNILIVNQ